MNSKPIEIGFPSKYQEMKLKGNTNDERWEYLKAYFENDKADHMNMLMGSTSGIHGTYTTLDDLENPAYIALAELDISHHETFTILVIQPRIVRMTYGTVGIRSQKDIDWLRDIITQSIAAFAKSQEGNTCPK